MPDNSLTLSDQFVTPPYRAPRVLSMSGDEGSDVVEQARKESQEQILGSTTNPVGDASDEENATADQ